MKKFRRLAVTTAVLSSLVGGVFATGPAHAETTLNVLMVGNPQMKDLQKYTADNFTKQTGIKVNFTVLPENELRDKVNQDVSSGAGQYDIVTLGMFDIALWGGTGKIKPIDSLVSGDSAWNKSDIFPSMINGLSVGGKLYGAPFYGESSMTMYRKDLLAKAGVTMPLHPTWAQIAAIAAKVDDKKNGVAGICLRGLPGWGESGAIISTMVNTFGGAWFTADWKAHVNGKEYTDAVSFYKNLVNKYGQPGVTQSGFTECDNAMAQGKAAIWVDATSATASLENPSFSKYVGKFGYAYAPINKTKFSGWLWAWAFALEGASKKDADAWKFMSWATSSDYENLVGKAQGYATIPDGKRASTYAIPEYKTASAAFNSVVLGSLKLADPNNPGLQKRPTPGIAWTAVPEYSDLGMAVTQEIAKAVTGKQTVKAALDKGQKLAEAVAVKYRK